MSRGTILVTGATGNVGSLVLKHLEVSNKNLDQEAAWVVSTGNNPLTGAKFRFNDATTWDHPLEGVSRVFLVRPPAMANIARDMEGFLRYLARKPVELVVFLSVQGAETMSFVPHAVIEGLLTRLGIPSIMLRPSFFMENLSGTHREEIQKYHTIMVPAGRGLTNFIACDDIAQVAAKCLLNTQKMTSPVLTYTLTGPAALGYPEVANLLSAALGRTIRYPKPGILRFVVHRLGLGTSLGQVLTMVALYSITRLGLAPRGRSTDLEDLLGRPPRSMVDWIEEHKEAWL